MTKILLVMLAFACLSITSVYAQQKALGFDLLIFDNDTVEMSNLQVRYGKTEPVMTIMGTHKLELLDVNGNILWEKGFTMTFRAEPNWEGPPGMEEPVYIADRMYEYTQIPHNPAFRILRVYRGTKQIFSEDIGRLLCDSDTICDGRENYLSCPPDCGDNSKDGFCDRIRDGTCDGDCSQNADPDCAGSQTYPPPSQTPESPCGNSICESSETFKTCARDCPSGGADGYCDRMKEGICDPDCPAGQDVDCPREDGTASGAEGAKQESNKTLIFIIAGLLVALGLGIIGVMLIINKKPPRQPPQPPPRQNVQVQQPSIYQTYQRQQQPNYQYRIPPRR